jgi:hypothetical protein
MRMHISFVCVRRLHVRMMPFKSTAALARYRDLAASARERKSTIMSQPLAE